ncbi:MAG: TlpA family protein disulfide reductase [Actinomycetota bacterium]
MPSSARVKLALLSLIPLSVGGLTLLAAALQPSEEPGSVAEISRAIPAIEGEWLNGGPLMPDDYRGKVVVVNFWADWCGPCRNEQPGLQRLSEEYEGRVQFIGVNFKDDQAKAREFIREFGVTYPSVVDDGPLANRFQMQYPPTTFVVDRTGIMRYQLLGEQDEGELRAYIEELL